MVAKGTAYTDNGESVTFSPDTGEYWEYAYDLLNRLTTVKKSAAGTDNAVTIARYTYDGKGYRVKRQDGDGKTTYYAYNSAGQIVYEETERSVREYVYINGQAFALKTGGQKYFYQTDNLGSTVVITNEAGEQVWGDDYAAFGNTTGDYGFIDELGLYTGKDFDSDTGLYYYNSRWYDPNLGRFITEDPIKDGMNWYMYANGNPLRYIDLTGLWIWNGDGTATAQAGDTLWGLSERVSGNGANWTAITGHSKAPETLQIGETVDYRGMTTTVPVNALVVEVSGATAARVQQQMSAATTIFNSQGVAVSFQTSIQAIQPVSSSGKSLLGITAGDTAANVALMMATGTALSPSGSAVPLVDPTGASVNLVYTQTVTSTTDGALNGIAFDGSTTALLSSGIGPSTTAHELGHVFGLDEWRRPDRSV